MDHSRDQFQGGFPLVLLRHSANPSPLREGSYSNSSDVPTLRCRGAFGPSNQYKEPLAYQGPLFVVRNLLRYGDQFVFECELLDPRLGVLGFYEPLTVDLAAWDQVVTHVVVTHLCGVRGTELLVQKPYHCVRGHVPPS